MNVLLSIYNTEYKGINHMDNKISTIKKEVEKLKESGNFDTIADIKFVYMALSEHNLQVVHTIKNNLVLTEITDGNVKKLSETSITLSDIELFGTKVIHWAEDSNLCKILSLPIDFEKDFPVIKSI